MMIPILVTLVGIVTDVSDEHPSKAFAPSVRVSDIMVVIVMLVVIVVMIPIVVTLVGIVILVIEH